MRISDRIAGSRDGRGGLKSPAGMPVASVLIRTLQLVGAKSMSAHDIFVVFIVLHIITGAPGLIVFWVPVAARKGGKLHRLSGRLFAIAMLITALAAAIMSSLTLWQPMETHPHLAEHAEFSDPALVRGIFGWMMLYLSILTINLAWYGWRAAVNKHNHTRNRDWVNGMLQLVLLVASAQCALQGFNLGQPMMIGMSLVGFATVGTNLWFLLRRSPGPVEWLLEHIKAIVGTGISVYTAFFAFGAVRLVPELALAPVLWAVPLLIGLGLILYYRHQVSRRFRVGKASRLATHGH
ncbi:hypothetical protein L2D00_08835 [Hyphomonadaceae bacterium BL14]|nr:hypothetical protein L2D00_08835 [Hyphomonadaceae bacterium BL14]